MLPNLIIIGAMKCGTTSLHSYLNQHPEIQMSRQKELDFFVDRYNWDLGLDWYQSQFKGNAKIYGESSPNYSNYPSMPNVARRMYDLVPQTKIIYLVRDPIARMISHYIHKYSARIENLPIQKALIEHQAYLSRSLYYFQLEQFLAYYPPSQILVIAAEDLYEQTALTLRRVYEFLEVDPSFYTWQSEIALHRSIRKRRQTELAHWLINTSPLRAIDRLPPNLRWPIEGLINYFFAKPIAKPKLSDILRDELTERLRNDVKKLREFTGYDFQQWSI